MTVRIFVCRHQPEGGQKALALRNLQPGFKQAIGELALALRGDSPGGVGSLTVMRRFHRTDEQPAVFQKDVFRSVHIFLPLLIDPAGFMEFHVPAAPVQFRPLKMILENERVSIIGKRILRHAASPLSFGLNIRFK